VLALVDEFFATIKDPLQALVDTAWSRAVLLEANGCLLGSMGSVGLVEDRFVSDLPIIVATPWARAAMLHPGEGVDYCVVSNALVCGLVAVQPFLSRGDLLAR
jgi:hypothetical protein